MILRLLLALLLIISCIHPRRVLAQDSERTPADLTITLVVIGEGKTRQEAVGNGLRNAIEQAFGAFVSSKTLVANDKLILDETITVSNGNIHSYQVLSEQSSSNSLHLVTLKASVSVSRLVAFCSSKGVAAEFNGTVFAFNIRQQKLNETNEQKAIRDVFELLCPPSDIYFRYTISAGNPVAATGTPGAWNIPLSLEVYPTPRFMAGFNRVFNCLKGCSMSLAEARNYIELGKTVHPISFAISDTTYGHFLLRTESAQTLVLNSLTERILSALECQVDNGISKFRIPQSAVCTSPNQNRMSLGKPDGRRTPDSALTQFALVAAHLPKQVCRQSLLQAFILVQDPAHWWAPDVFIPNTGNSAFLDKLRRIKEGSGLFSGRFGFVRNLQENMLFKPYQYGAWNGRGYDSKSIRLYQPGLVISSAVLDDRQPILRIQFNDTRTLEDVERISSYKVIPREL